MKLEMQMTARDKKLLIFLTVFVLVVGIGYWGVKPQIKAAIELSEEIEIQETNEYMNQLKISELPIFEKDIEDYETEIAESKENYFKMMTSDQVDKYMTGMALSYNLYCYDLAIFIPEEPVKTEAYQYSSRYIENQNSYDEYFDEEDDEIAEDDMGELSDYELLDEIVFAEEDEMVADEFTGVYEAKVSMRLGGNEGDIQRFIDDFSINDMEVLVNSYSWNDVETASFNEELEDYEVKVERVLNIDISLFMCEE